MSGNRFYPRKGVRRETYAPVFGEKRGKGNKWNRNTDPIPREVFVARYVDECKSMQEIASALKCSLHKVMYWMEKYKIPRRRLSEAMYVKRNPGGDPFRFMPPRTMEEAKLFGLGLGLYWGEGTKSSLDSIRLGNTNPKLIGKFILFLERFFGIKKNDLRFGLQIFSDTAPKLAMDFWVENLKINQEQFYKVVVTRSGSIGTYRHKNQYGVMTVHYHNKKARALLGSLLPE
ncbi:MAG: hypothetical protein V1696_03440 [Candidatus Jorgensenbacteria bacterium]